MYSINYSLLRVLLSMKQTAENFPMMINTVEVNEHIYNHFWEENWDELQRLCEEHSFHVHIPLNHLGDTALHLAAYSQNKKLMRSLLDIVYKDDAFYRDNIFAFSSSDAPGKYSSKNESSDAPGKLSLKNESGNTPLHEAASTGNIEVVDLILEYDHENNDRIDSQLKAKNKDDQTPFFIAAVYGKTELIKHWAKNLEDIEKHVVTEKSTMLHEAIRGCYFDTALELLNPTYSIPLDKKDLYGMTAFQLLANNSNAFKSGHSLGLLKTLIYDGLSVPNDEDEGKTNNVTQVNPGPKTNTKHVNIGLCIGIKSLRDMKKQHIIVGKLTKILAKRSWQDYNTSTYGPMRNKNNNTPEPDAQDDTPPIAVNGILDESPQAVEHEKHDSPLIAAAKNGITEIVNAILDVCPQAIEHENHKGENVFHVAVENRRTNVLNLLKIKKFNYSRVIGKFNEDGDGILHKAAYRSKISLRERPGDALCLQSDIQWFEKMRKMVPKHHINQQNKNGDTPQALFTKEHKEMVNNGREWLIRTTNSCIIVAVLIATVAFTSIYTVPGGSDKKTGEPLLLNTTAFTVFTASDVASLCFAFTSVVVFLSITTSKMNEQDFRISLPLKLVLGLSMLFFSVAALMIGFAATLVITIRQRVHQATAPIIAIACFPVAFFLRLQLSLYTNITWFTTKDLVGSLTHLIPSRKLQP